MCYSVNMYAKSLSDFPDERSYVIATPQSVHIPGDERSRTAPGHGYPSSTHYYLDFQVFENKEEWETAVAHIAGTQKSYRAFVLNPATVTTTITVQTEEDF